MATAVYSDGRRRDVSSAAAYASNAVLVAEVDAHGLARIGRVPGQAAVTVQLSGARRVGGGASAAARRAAAVPAAACKQRTRSAGVGQAGKDGHTAQRTGRRRHVPAAGVARRDRHAADARRGSRVSGRSAIADKRARADRRGCWRDEYADFWALKWSDILLVDRESAGRPRGFELHRWLREQFAANRPYDQWVRELVTASGNSGTVGAGQFLSRRRHARCRGPRR